jgi:hypothetical protein
MEAIESYCGVWDSLINLSFYLAIESKILEEPLAGYCDYYSYLEGIKRDI